MILVLHVQSCNSWCIPLLTALNHNFQAKEKKDRQAEKKVLDQQYKFCEKFNADEAVRKEKMK